MYKKALQEGKKREEKGEFLFVLLLFGKIKEMAKDGIG